MIKFLLVFILIIISNEAGSVKIIGLEDDGKTPLQKFLDNQLISGVYDVHNPIYCSQKAKKQYLSEILPLDTALKVMKNGNQVTVKGNMDILVSIIKNALDMLNKNSDLMTYKKHVCVGFFNDEKAINGNAYSHGHGYMIFDFKLIQYLYNLPDEMRSSWVFDYLALHEFAHQLQYWNADEEILNVVKNKQSSKNSELAADCVSAALLTNMNINLPPDLFDVSAVGITGGAYALGDFLYESPDHHGTPEERKKAAQFGINMIIDNMDSIKSGILKHTSGSILKSCNTFVKLTLN